MEKITNTTQKKMKRLYKGFLLLTVISFIMLGMYGLLGVVV